MLLGSSPTSGASDMGSTKRNKNKQTEFVLKTKSKDMVRQHSQITNNKAVSVPIMFIRLL